MSFQGLWEELRKKGIQTTRYPYDKVISFVMRYYPRDKKRREIKILEIGCGAGNNLWALAMEGFDVYGIDGSETAIKMAKEMFSKLGLSGNFIVGDFTEPLPYPDEEFDLVIDRGSITCVNYEEAKKTVKEIYRVLKHGGYLFFNPYSKKHTSYTTSRVRIDEMYVLTESGTISGTGYVCFYEKEDVLNILKEFQVIELKELILTDYINSNVHGEFEVVCKKV